MGVLDTISTVTNFFANIGASCVDIVNGALEVFSKFVFSSADMLTKDIHSEEFADFWAVVDNVGSVLGVIASTLMVLLFLINMCTDTWDSRHDLDLFGVIKKCAKMIVAIALVNNAVPIVTGIFQLGAKLAKVVMFGTDSQGVVYSKLKLATDQSTYIEYGVSGFKGFLMFLVFLIAAIAIIASGVMIAVEIYTRVFKIFILIPFSTISFTTFVMGDGNRGNEVFHSYLKSILSTAIEALIIMVCLNFTYSLLAGDTMQKLIPATKTEASESMTVNGAELACLLLSISGDTPIVNGILNEQKDNISQPVKDLVNGKGRDKAISKYGCIVTTDGDVLEASSDLFSMFADLGKIISSDDLKEQTVSIKLYPAFTWSGVFFTILQFLFPIFLCTGGVKKVEQFSAYILGR